MAQNELVSQQRSLAPARWWRIMPLAFITYSLAYLDRVNFGFGAAGGLSKTLGITQGISALLSALFFLGYFFFQVPGASFAAKRSAKKLIFWSLIAWGVLASLTGVITNIPLLAVDRFLLGVVESVVLPAMLVYLTHWFTSGERSRANTFLILGNPVTVLWASIASGYLIQALGWQWMFILEGLPPIIWAFIWLAIADNRPADAKWMSPEETTAIEQKLVQEQSGIQAVKNYWAAFRTPSVILLAIQYLLWSVGTYGFILWLPSIIQVASKQGLGISGLLSAVPYALAIILMLVTSYYSDRMRERKKFVWPYLLVGGIALFVSYAIGSHNFWLSFLCLVIAGGCMYAPYGPFFAIMPEILPSNVSGEAMALINSCGALGSFVGVYLVGWIRGATGGNAGAFVLMGSCLILSAILTMIIRMRNPASMGEHTREALVPTAVGH
jgi:sugar phosphate permease